MTEPADPPQIALGSAGFYHSFLGKASRAMKRSILLTVLFMILAVPLSLAQETTQEQPNLTGSWALNEKMSDDIHQIMMKAMGGNRGAGRGSGGPGGGRGGGGGGGGGRGGNMGGQPGGEQSGSDSQAQKHAEEMKKQQSSLEIFQDGLELNITDGLDITRLLHTDGRSEKIWTQRGEATASAHWDKNILVVEWKTGKDPKARSRNYELSEDGGRLTVSEKLPIPNSKDTVSAKLVYNLQK